jgi:hypothetical protein
VGIRGVPVVEAMMALVLADQKLMHPRPIGGSQIAMIRRLDRCYRSMTTDPSPIRLIGKALRESAPLSAYLLPQEFNTRFKHQSKLRSLSHVAYRLFDPTLHRHRL